MIQEFDHVIDRKHKFQIVSIFKRCELNKSFPTKVLDRGRDIPVFEMEQTRTRILPLSVPRCGCSVQHRWQSAHRWVIGIRNILTTLARAFAAFRSGTRTRAQRFRACSKGETSSSIQRAFSAFLWIPNWRMSFVEGRENRVAQWQYQALRPLSQTVCYIVN